MGGNRRCAAGAGAEFLRATGATYLAGVEIEREFARLADARYDEVVCGSAEAKLPWGPASFDTVLCYDVLEHLYDPWTLVRRLHTMLTREGQIDVSIPTLRYREALLPLVVKGRFVYQPSGVLDVTHVRFFTRSSAEELLSDAGYRVTRVAGRFTARRDRLAARLTLGRSAEFSVRQWYLTAVV